MSITLTCHFLRTPATGHAAAACPSVTWDPALGADSNDDSEAEDHQDDDPFNFDPFENSMDEDVFDDDFPYQPQVFNATESTPGGGDQRGKSTSARGAKQKKKRDEAPPSLTKTMTLALMVFLYYQATKSNGRLILGSPVRYLRHSRTSSRKRPLRGSWPARRVPRST